MLNNTELSMLEKYLVGAVHLDVKINKRFSQQIKTAIIEYQNGKKKIAVFKEGKFEISDYNNFSSVQEYVSRGVDGSARYRGNCCGQIIEQFINYSKNMVNSNLMIADPMQGSGTSLDVVKRLGLEDNYWGSDLSKGFNVLTDDIPVAPNVIWVHPPYFVPKSKRTGEVSNMPIYSGSQWGTSKDISLADGSHLHDYKAYIKWLNEVQYRLHEQIRRDGRIGMLFGASKMEGEYFDPIFDMATYGKVESVIIKKQNNCYSDNLSYSNNNFIAIEHEYLVIFRKNNSVIVPCRVTRELEVSMLKAKNVTWKGLIMNVIEELGGRATIEQVYELVKDSPKSEGNNYVREKVRQVLNVNTGVFTRISTGSYELNTKKIMQIAL